MVLFMFLLTSMLLEMCMLPLFICFVMVLTIFNPSFLYGVSSTIFLAKVLVALSLFLVNLFVFKFGKINFKIMMILVSVGSMIFYTTSNWLVFFVSFEGTMLPVLVLIFYFSLTPERLRASWYLLVYTLLSSIPLLLSILNTCQFTFWMAPAFPCEVLNQPLCFILAFLFKVPLFLFHSWLPKAHVEATLEGSVILAGVVLKFGTFGLYRVSEGCSWSAGGLIESLLLSLSAYGTVISSLKALVSTDLKKVVAYSSIGHMNLSVLSFMVLKNLSFYAFWVYMLSHSLSASVLFALVTSLYEKSGSRNLLVAKMNVKLGPSLMVATVLSWSANMALPPFVSFVPEYIYVVSVMAYTPEVILLVSTGMFFTSVYSITHVVGGVLSSLSQSCSTLSVKLDRMSELFLLTIPSLTMFLSLNWLVCWF
uniref:NADH-ubiquinone oxidoreductase chain 4 n=1 Tax=Pthirus pubis TaxID=121228 RepID=A0A7H1K1B6_PTHPU|nr:NADH dehydrogenase subunit 4 [Pthirus pubis]